VTGAALNRGASRQDYATPSDFLNAFRARFGDIVFDLAAHERNHVAERYFSPSQDLLSQDWGAELDKCSQRQWLWLNPPFANIGPWAWKCARHARRAHATMRGIALLVPASVGSLWWYEHVAPHAQVYFLIGRLHFSEAGPFPKDCALCLFGPEPGHHYWDWRDRYDVPAGLS
jgi:phage N-6-adenine-methyltransferase